MTASINKLPITVVIPAYNSSNTIIRSLKSIEEQTILPAEVIIIDDASSDETIRIIENFILQTDLNIKLFINPINIGAASTRNIGILNSNNPYIAFLDSDDTWHPFKLEIQFKCIEEYKYDIIGHSTISNDFPSYFNSLNLPINICKYYLLFKNPFNTPSVIIKKDTSLLFNEGQRYAEDIQLWQSYAFSGKKVGLLPIALARVHKHFYGENGLSKNLFQMEYYEIKNFYLLLRSKKILFITFIFISVFSLFKFSKRVINSYIFSTKRH